MAAIDPGQEAGLGLLAGYLDCWGRWVRQPDHRAVEPQAGQSLWVAYDLGEADTPALRHFRELLRQHAAELGIQFVGTIGTGVGTTTSDVASFVDKARTVRTLRSGEHRSSWTPINGSYRTRSAHGYDDEPSGSRHH